MTRLIRFWTRLGTAALLLGLVSACATKTHIILPDKIEDRVEEDLLNLYSDLPEPGTEITLSEAIARAIKYNLDNRLKLMESVVAQQRLELLDFEKLPQLAANAGYTVRSARQASSSLNLGTGVPNFGASTSQDRGIVQADLQLSWDTLDFGIAYLRARQASNEVLIATERQRKTIQNIVRDVRYAYWRMLGAQSLGEFLPVLLAEIRQGLNDSYAAQAAKLLPLEECLDYQRAMLDIQRQMHGLQRDINNARIELTALMGLPPGYDFKTADDFSNTKVTNTETAYGTDELQLLALKNRPELIEEDYKKRIAIDEIKLARLRMIPGLELFTGYNFNDNSFLLNNNWAASGYRLTWDLLRLVSGPRAIRHAKSNVELADIRRLATSMAVLTQVNVAIHRREQAESDYTISREMARVDSSLLEEYEKRHSVSQIDHLTLIETKARSLLSSLRHAVAFADWQDSIAQLQVTVGYQPAVILDHNADLNNLTSQVDGYMGSDALNAPEGFFKPATTEKAIKTAQTYKRGGGTQPPLSIVSDSQRSAVNVP